MKSKLFRFLKGIYKKLPFNYKFKNKLKGLFYRCFGFLFKNTTSYRAWNAINYKEEKKENIKINTEAVSTYNCKKKIAVQLHLFYVDLADEFVKYFMNIPFSFDLLISIVDKSQFENVKDKFSKIEKLEEIFIEVVQNRGRDVAPLVSVFGNKILQYNYVCHVHSKKSLFTGSEQTEWRQYLLNGLFGSEEIVRSHLYQMDKGEHIGLLYPETFYMMPYQGHTWLQNKHSKDELLERIGVNARSEEIYFDYPMGTMFWADVRAISQFFTAQIKVEGFPKEAGQKDGTIAHAFERCLGLVCKYNGYNLLVFDKDNKSYSYSGNKNLNQYMMKSYDGLMQELKTYDVVSFDIFDTLLSRKISNPNAIKKMLEQKVNYKFSIDSNFYELRINAENNFRNKNADIDCDLKQIYGELMRMSKLPKEVVEWAYEKEIEIEMLLLEPKENMVNVLTYAINNLGKNVCIVSDMHLDIDVIKAALVENGIPENINIFLSSQLNKRKDNGKMWEHFAGIMEGKSCIHIGDDEVSDMQIPGDYKISNYHIMGNKTLYQLTNLGKRLGYVTEDKACDAVQYGLVLNKLFSNPFKYNADRFDVKIREAKLFGYSIIGPAILNYILWLATEAKKASADKILFFSREGFVLKKVYDVIVQQGFIDAVDAEYIYVSRRALSFASIENDDDLSQMLEKYYEGKMKNLLYERFDVEIEDSDDEDVKLPDNKNKVLKILNKYKSDIYDRARKEREEYLKYLADYLGSDDTIFVSDIGYSGTIQYYLSKMTNKAYHGRYFATDDKKLAERIDGNSMVGYFIDNDAEQEISVSNIHKYHLLLESILIAPDGQLVKIQDKNPIFNETVNVLYNETIERIQAGIMDFARDYAAIMKELVLEELPNKELAEGLINIIIKEDILDSNVTKALVLDDRYCGSGLMNPIDYYKR